MAEVFPIGSSKNWSTSTVGDKKEWELDIDSIGGYLEVLVSGNTSGTDVTIALNPNFYTGSTDARIFPDTRTGSNLCKGTATDASIKLKTQSSYPDSNTVPDFYLPRGHWKLTLTANKASNVTTKVSLTPLVEEISAPAKPNGPASTTKDQSCTYIIGGASSNFGDPLQYQVTWGDGLANSAWTDAATALAGITHTWTKTGTWNITAQARCKTHITKESVSGPALSVVVGTTLDTVSKPQSPQGPASGSVGASLTYTTGGSIDSIGHTVEYSMLWGDGTQSSWTTGTSFTKSSGYTSTGTYSVIAVARCATNIAVQTQSDPTPVNIGSVTETFTTPPQMASTGNPPNGQTYIQYTFTATIAILSTGHPVQYRFEFGDNPGIYTSWSSALTGQHTYTANSPSGSPYQVKVQASCATDTNNMSAWSSPWFVTIGAITETVSKPNTPTGGPSGIGQTGTSYTFTTGGSTSTAGSGHTIQYQFDWGDGNYSGWSSSITTTKTWSTANTYQVKAQAKCLLDGTLSSLSNALSVTISGESVSKPTSITGPSTGTKNASYTFTTSGSASTLSHPVEYQFDWSDGLSNWGTGSDSHSFPTSNKTYGVRSRARCKSDTGVISDWTLYINIGIDITATTDIDVFNSQASIGYYAAGYAFGCYDPVHSYVYYAPAYVRYGPYTTIAKFHGLMLRYNTTLPFSQSTSWESQNMINIATLGAWANGYHGAVYYNGFIYFVPLADSSVTPAINGTKTVRFNTNGTGGLGNSANWEYFDTSLLNAGCGAYVNGFEARGYIYYCVWASGKIVRFNANGSSAGDFNTIGKWEYIDLTTFTPSVNAGYSYAISATKWPASFVLGAGYASNIFGSTTGVYPNDTIDGRGYFKLQSYGTTGSSQPNWNFTIGSTTIDNTVTWICVDPHLVNTNPVEYIGMHGGCYDNEKYIYFGQSATTNDRLIWQCDLDSTWANQSSWQVFDLARITRPTTDAEQNQVGHTYGMVAIGGKTGKVYGANNVRHSGVATTKQWRLKNPAKFTDPSSYDSVDMVDVVPDRSLNPLPQWPNSLSDPSTGERWRGAEWNGYAGMCSDGTYAYYAPDFGSTRYLDSTDAQGGTQTTQTGGIVARHRISSTNLQTGWEFCDLAWGKNINLTGFHGVITDGTYIYLVPISHAGYNPISNPPSLYAIVGDESRFVHGYHAKILISSLTAWTVGKGTVRESIGVPGTPTGGPTGAGIINTSYTFTVSGGTSGSGHTIQYYFNWGDGTNSGWLSAVASGGSSSANKIYLAASTPAYYVQAKCRCATDLYESNFSQTLTVYINPATGTETAYPPTNFNGDMTLVVNNESKYTCTLPKTSKGHDEQLYIDWDDSTNTGWLPRGTNYAYKSWSAAGTYHVISRARCATLSDVGNISDWTSTYGVTVVPDGGVADYVFDTGIIDVTSYSTSDVDSAFAKNNKIGTEADSVVIISFNQATVAYNNAALNTTIADLVGKLNTLSVKFAMGLNPNPAAIDTFVTNAASLVTTMNTQLNYWYTKTYLTVGQVARVFIDVPVDASYPYTGTTWLTGFKNFMNAAISQIYSNVNARGSYAGIEIWWRIAFNDLKGLRNSVTSGAFQTEYTSVLSGIASSSGIVAKNIKLFSCLSDGVGNYGKPGNPTSMYGTRQPGDSDYTAMIAYTQAHLNCATTNIKCKSICDLWRYTDTVLTSQTSGGTDETLDKDYEAFKFTATSTSFNKVKISVKRDGAMTAGTLQLYLYTNNASSKPGSKVSGSIESSIYQYYVVTTSYATIEFDLSVAGLAIGTSYWVVIKQTSTGGSFYINRM